MELANSTIHSKNGFAVTRRFRIIQDCHVDLRTLGQGHWRIQNHKPIFHVALICSCRVSLVDIVFYHEILRTREPLAASDL